MALQREPIAQPSMLLVELLQEPIEINIDSAPHDLLIQALQTCTAQHGHQPSLSEITRFIQLLNARQNNAQPTDIEVRWVDPPSFEDQVRPS